MPKQRLKDPFVSLHDQSRNCALLYSPRSRYKAAPLTLKPSADDWDDALFQRMRPFISEGLGPDVRKFFRYSVRDWDGLAGALNLPGEATRD